MIIHNENKFKVTAVSVRFKEEIKKENVGLRALLPNLMSASTPTYKTRKALNEALESLYGASISAMTYKLGKLSIVDFTLTIINPKYMDDGFFNLGIKTLSEIIFGHKNLPKKDFELEKRLLLEKIEASKNNKTAYALEKLFKIMFENERYAINVRGMTSDILSLTYEKLNTYYKQFLHSDYDVIISGEIDENTINIINNYFKPQNKHNLIPPEDEIHVSGNLKVIYEEDDINQSKVNLGYNLNISYQDELYYAAVLFNLIFGGSFQSRLFSKLREKESLCYYIDSNFDVFKGFLYVYTGVDKSQVDFAINLINEELVVLQTNLVKEDELEAAKKQFIDSLKKNEDSQSSSLNRKYLTTLLNNEKTLKKRIEKCNNVKATDILKVAKMVKLDTIYVLNPKE